MIKYFKYLRRRYRIKRVCQATIRNLKMVLRSRGMTKEKFGDHIKTMRSIQGYYKNNVELIDIIPTKNWYKISINKDKLNKA